VVKLVIWFNVEKARNYLLRNGYVYTLRPKKRREGIEVLSYEGFGKKGVVYVSFVKEIESDEELKEFVSESGFETVEEWRKEAGESRFLYYVFTVKQNLKSSYW
jgi:reverse gyrase